MVKEFGAQEAKGLRGSEYVLPVIKNLVEREKEVEPFKITLQVSSKGIKIIQNVPAPLPDHQPLVPNSRGFNKNQKTEVIKHFIPHHTLTYVLQDNDIVAYILLLFNPVTKCPVHVHAHRCDSTETAFTLTNLLQTLIDRPENQKKLNTIEVNLKTKGLLPVHSNKQLIKRPTIISNNSDRGSGVRKSVEPPVDSERNGCLIPRTPSQDRIANLYDSLAAELREKLGTSNSQPHAPILLPPRDYDTVHRQKGNLANIDIRGCLNANIVGVNAKNVKKNRDVTFSQMISSKSSDSRIVASTNGLQRTKIGSSGGSSGIGSDHAPSPEQDSDTRFLDNESSSDEDWNVESSEDPMFLMQPHVNSNSWRGDEVFLPKVRRHNSSGLDSNRTTQEQEIMYKGRVERDNRQLTPTSDLEITQVRSRRSDSTSGPEEFGKPKKYVSGPQKLPDRHEVQYRKPNMAETSPQLLDSRRKKVAEQRQRSPSLSRKSVAESMSPLERFQDAKEKFLSMERERLDQENLMKAKKLKEQPVIPAVAKRNVPGRPWRHKDTGEDLVTRSENHRSDHDRYSYDEEVVEKRRPEREQYLSSCSRESLDSDDFSGRQPSYRPQQPDDRLFKYRYGSPPRKEVLPPGYRKSSPIETHSYDKYPLKHGVHYQNSERGYDVSVPRPAPRSYSEDCLQDNEGYIGNNVPYEENIPLERYRSPNRMNVRPVNMTRQPNVPRPSPRTNFVKDCEDGVKRSNSRYFAQSYMNEQHRKPESPEDEKRRNFQELAKEFKRKSYQEPGEYPKGYHDVNDAERYHGLDRGPSRYHEQSPNTPPRYRHSYAEPLHHRNQPPVQRPHHGLIQRTNSFLSSGRVGVAAVHPY